MKRKRGSHFEGKTNKQTKTTSNLWTRENNHSVLLSFDLKSHFLLWRKLAGVVPRACWEWSRGSNRQDRVWGVRWKRGESCPFAKGCHLCQCTGLNHVVCLVALLLFFWPMLLNPQLGTPDSPFLTSLFKPSYLSRCKCLHRSACLAIHIRHFKAGGCPPHLLGLPYSLGRGNQLD